MSKWKPPKTTRETKPRSTTAKWNPPRDPRPGGFQVLRRPTGDTLACERHRTWFAAIEVELAEQVSGRSRRRARRVNELIVEAALTCGECPLLVPCGISAETERYTGIAGGGVYTGGRRREVSTR